MTSDERPEARLQRQLLSSPPLSSVRELNLSHCALTSLPSELLAAKDTLELLNLGDNQLSDFPESLSLFSRLRVLFCLNNRFETIPAVVGRLPSLYMLSFKSNRLRAVPENSLAPSIGWLILTDNKLKSLPESIGALTGLRKLMLASNELETLPEGMRNLHALELVRLSDNRLDAKEFDKLAELPKLSWIAFAGQHQPQCPLPGRSIAFSDLELGPVIGTGASGTVHKAHLRQPNGDRAPVAVKLFKPASSDGRPIDEVAVASALPDHPHVIRVLGTFSQPSLGMVMELLGDDMCVLGRTPSFDSVMRDVYDSNQTLSPIAGARILLGVALAVAHLHENGVMHGDLYAHNTLVTLSGEVTIVDFGAAFAYRDMNTSAPFELMEVRAFGCLVEEVASLVVRMTATHPIVATLTSLADDCFQPKPRDRPPFSEIVRQLLLVAARLDVPPASDMVWTSWAHSSTIYDVAVSPDSTMIASASLDGTVAVLERASGTVLRRFTGHEKTDSVHPPVQRVAFAPDTSQRIASAGVSNGCAVLVWDAHTLRLLHELKGNTDYIMALGWSPDGRLIASGSNDGRAVVWRADDGAAMFNWAEDSSYAGCLAFSPNSRLLLVGRGGPVTLYDVATGTTLGIFGPHQMPVKFVGFLYGGREALSASFDGQVSVWDVDGRQHLRSFSVPHREHLWSAALTPKGACLISIDDSDILATDVASSKELGVVASKQPVTYAVAITSDGAHIVISHRDGSVKLWNVPPIVQLEERSVAAS